MDDINEATDFSSKDNLQRKQEKKTIGDEIKLYIYYGHGGYQRLLTWTNRKRYMCIISRIGHGSGPSSLLLDVFHQSTYFYGNRIQQLPIIKSRVYHFRTVIRLR